MKVKKENFPSLIIKEEQIYCRKYEEVERQK